jgi:hypothetical protein
VQSDAFGEAVKIAQNYFTAKANLEESIKTAKKEYQGGRQQKEVKILQDKISELRDPTLDKISGCFAKHRKTIEELRARTAKRSEAMGLDMISPDFAFLESKSVILTQQELQTLTDRNSGNLLFSRAAKAYSDKHEIPIITGEERIAHHENAITNAIGALQNFVQRNNTSGLSIFLKSRMGEYDTALAAYMPEWNEPETPISYHDIPVNLLDFDKISRSDIINPKKYSSDQLSAWKKFHGV